MKKLKAISGFFVLALGLFFLAPTDKVLAADSISYQSPQYYEIGKEITPLSPTVSGSGYAFSTSPALPNGLSIDLATGVISGTPYVLSLAKTYTITATNEQGSQTFNLSLASLYKPTSFNYSEPVRFFTINRLVTDTLVASKEQLGVVYSTSPELPDGLSINPVTGEISGFATEVSGLTSYIVSASNALGVATTSVSIAVPMPWTGLGSPIISSGASQPFLNFIYTTDSIYVPYVIYSNSTESSIVVVKYDYSSKTWVQVGNTVSNVTGEQNKIVFDTNNAPYISYISNGGVFVKKYNSQTNKWESLSSAYNSSSQETGSSLSNNASNHDTIINPSNDTYESYVDNGSLNIVKLIDNPVEYSSIDNLESESAIGDFSYGTSSIVFGTGSKINPLYPLINSSKPASFTVSPSLPAGLSLVNGSGVIYGAPILASDETTYVITAKNGVSTATTSLKIKVLGPWIDTAREMSGSSMLGSRLITQASNGDFYLSYYSSSGTGDNLEGTNHISKYNFTTSSWENIYSCNKTTMNFSEGIIDSEKVMGLATQGDDLYAVIIKDDVDYSNEESPSFSSRLYVKKYDSSSSTWATLGEMQDSLINPFLGEAEMKIAFSGSDLFLGYYTSDGYIYIYKFDETSGSFGSSSITDLSTNHSYIFNPDSNLFVGDANNLYLAYSGSNSDTSVDNVVIKVMNQVTGEWSTYTDDESSVNLSELTGLNVDSLKVGSNGKIYVSYYYSGNYFTAEEGVTDLIQKSVVKELDLESGTFTEILGDMGDVKNTLSFDRDGSLWSSSGEFSKDGHTLKKYSDGTWSDMFSGKQFVSPYVNVRYPELFFGPTNEAYVFMDRTVSPFAKYNGTEAPINYDQSVAPTINYPKQSYTYVTGKRINQIYPTVVGYSKDESIVTVERVDGSNSDTIPSGLNFSSGVIFGTPLIATTTVLRMSVSNDVGSDSVDITLNIIDPWSPLGAPLSSSAQSASLGIDANSKLYIVYSETVNSVNQISVSKYENEIWNHFDSQVSDSGVSASYPKISNYYNNIFVVYREDVSGKLIVKMYNSQTEIWDQIGGAVAEYSGVNFDLDTAGDQLSVIYYDDVNNRSIVKTYKDGLWEIKGGYLEQGNYPSLYKNNDKVYAAYSDDNGAVKVVSYEEINYAGAGKDVTLTDISSLIESGDVSPQGSSSATSTPAIKFNQKLNITPFTGASVLIPSGTIMTADESFDSSLLTSSSTVDLLGINSSFTPIGTMMFGLPNLGLTLSSPITISIPVSGVAENTQLQVYSKTAGGTWNSLTTCYVVAGKCSFQTSHLSEFAAGTIIVPSSGGGGSYVDPVKPICTSVTYGDFSSICSGGYFTRNILTQSPTGCVLSVAQIEAAKKTCTLPVENLESATSTIATSTDNITINLLKEVRDKFIALEKSLVKKINKLLTKKLLGHILLQVEGRGEAWYLDPISSARYYLADGENAYTALRQFGLGITNANIAKIPVGSYSYKGDIDTDQDGLSDKIENGLGTNPNLADTDKDGVKDGDEILKKNTNPLNSKKLSYSKALANKLKGRIVIQTEKRGEAWYINPVDGKRYYLADGEMAYQIMRYLSLGVTNANIRQVKIGDLK